MIYRVEIRTYFDKYQRWVNTRTANVHIEFINKMTHARFKCFAISPEINRENETEESYTSNFRRVYHGTIEGHILSQLGIQKFRKPSDAKELELEIAI